MISSSVNFDRFMVRSSSWAGLWHQMEEFSGVRAKESTIVGAALARRTLQHPTHDFIR